MKRVIALLRAAEGEIRTSKYQGFEQIMRIGLLEKCLTGAIQQAEVLDKLEGGDVHAGTEDGRMG